MGMGSSEGEEEKEEARRREGQVKGVRAWYPRQWWKYWSLHRRGRFLQRLTPTKPIGDGGGCEGRRLVEVQRGRFPVFDLEELPLLLELPL